MQADYGTLGVLVLYTRGLVAEWVDLIVSDLSLESLTSRRIRDLECELGGPVSTLEIARTSFDREHAEIPGSSAFTIIRIIRPSSMGDKAH
ncbi:MULTISPECIES: hypothetical protein [unclassified Streptomyces]|uniref:hypothetical protein n=1 Tax=unclassified Streptomyces TaxID=2593676 RepID=UPI00342D1462